MKSTCFSALLLSLLLSFTALPLLGCGPFNPIIPTPEFFGVSMSDRYADDCERRENLSLWQHLTSEEIPAYDIEQAVYRDSYEVFTEKLESRDSRGSNLFYNFIKNTDDTEIASLLMVAKELEERRNELLSPWYYPSERKYSARTDPFSDIQEQIESYKGSRLKDRYALQMVRLLFASRRYSECAAFADSVFSAFPDENLMKRMARKYEAGCWSRMGDTRRADTVFAQAGDIWSVSTARRIPLMCALNPGAPQFMEYIRQNAYDSLFMSEIEKITPRILKDTRVKNKGDWYFMLAYMADNYRKRPLEGRENILHAMRENFSSPKLKDLARTYKMKLDAKTGDISSLFQDLVWLEEKTSPLNADADDWISRLQNIIYQHWVPGLWKRGDKSTAILLAAYADNINNKSRREYAICGEIPYCYTDMCGSISIDEMRESERYFNFADYSSLSFQMMGILLSSELAKVVERIFTDKGQLYTFLRRLIRQDSDFYDELIGTLALREENYSRAEAYLSKVSDRYIRTTNIDKRGYLSRDPFTVYPSRWDV